VTTEIAGLSFQITGVLEDERITVHVDSKRFYSVFSALNRRDNGGEKSEQKRDLSLL